MWYESFSQRKHFDNYQRDSTLPTGKKKSNITTQEKIDSTLNDALGSQTSVQTSSGTFITNLLSKILEKWLVQEVSNSCHALTLQDLD